MKPSTPSSCEAFTNSWWIVCPTVIRRYSVVLSAAWADGIYLSAWSRLATILPALLVAIGLLEGATHWGLLTIGDGATSTGIHAVAFAQMLPLIIVAAIAGSLSANLGLAITLGYALGDFFVAGPQFSWGTPGVDQFLHLRVPQLVSYLLFFMLTVQPILTAQILTRSLKWLVQRPDAPSKIAAVIIMASLQGVLLYAWTLAAPMVIRILWDWAGATPPVTFTHFSEITSTWLPLAGVVASLARAWLSFRAAPSAAVARNIDALTRAFRQSDERPAPTRRMPIPVRAALSALLVTLFVSGFIATFALGLVIWAFVSGILIARSTILTKHPGWNQWAEFAQQIPLIFRWGAAMTASYLLARSTLALPGQAASINRAAGAFQAELVSLALTLVVCLLLLPATANR